MAEFIPQQAAQTTEGGTPGGRLMADALKEGGVDTIFGLCGGHILGFIDACQDVGIRIIDTRHEGAASLAAEGWALATGRTGFCAVTAGPGFANALIGFLDAANWTVPLVLLAGRTGLHQAGRGAVMDIDQRAVAAQVAKWAATCPEPEMIPRFTAEALYRARAGKPGAVYLEVPQNIFMSNAVPPLEGPAGFPAAVPRSAAAPEDLDRALEALERAERPVIIAGGGAFWSGAGEAITRLAERAQIPVVTTSAARGLVPDSHEWCLGSMVHGGFAISQADVVLVLGSMFNANMNFGRQPLFGMGQTVIQVDIRPEGIGGNRLPEIGIVGDVARVATDLAEGWRKNGEGRREWLDKARSLREVSIQMWDYQIENHAGGSRVHAGAMARDIAAWAREALGDGVTFVADGGDALTWSLAYFYAEGPGRLLSTTTALGTLGVGVPFAIAAKAARPDEAVIAVIGDGSFGLSAMEIDTAVRHKLPIVCVISNNYGWRDVSHEQDAWFGPGRQIASELQDTRYDKLAEALGAHGEHVTALDELRPALERAINVGKPAVVNVQTDPTVLSELLKNVGNLGLM